MVEYATAAIVHDIINQNGGWALARNLPKKIALPGTPPALHIYIEAASSVSRGGSTSIFVFFEVGKFINHVGALIVPYDFCGLQSTKSHVLSHILLVNKHKITIFISHLSG